MLSDVRANGAGALMVRRAVLLVAAPFLASAWAPPPPATTRGSPRPISAGALRPTAARPPALSARPPLGGEAGGVRPFDPLRLSSAWGPPPPLPVGIGHGLGSAPPAAAAVATLLAAPGAASAARAAPDAIPSALAAYGHYLSLLVIVAAIMTERLTVKPAMSIEEEKRIALADIMTGVSGTAVLVSGYYRATAYGKGWDFYSHEPIFWLKMTFLGIFGALSLFPTITIIQRSVKIQQEGTIEPMSEALAKRMTSILNAELSTLAVIPLTATLMARGVGYVDGFPTQVVGPAIFGVVTAGAVFKYVKDAVEWDEGAELVPAKEES